VCERAAPAAARRETGSRRDAAYAAARRWYTRRMPTTRPADEAACALFLEGFTCGQAVLAAFADRHGLDRDTALRLGCAFGGGVARTGSTCGAVNGALMAIGLAHGRTKLEDVAARDRTYELTRAFLAAFKKEHGSDLCRELLGVDIGTPEGHAAATRSGVFKTRCPLFVGSAARIVDGFA
jgi:C_GCAxxG_C_C family probable redox protein